MLTVALLMVIFLGIAKQAGWLVITWNFVVTPLFIVLGIYTAFALLCLIGLALFLWWTNKH